MDDWPADGPGARDAKEAHIVDRTRALGAAQRLRARWREVMEPVAVGRNIRITVDPKIFNAHRRTMLDQGATDETIETAFELFAKAIVRGGVNVKGKDAFRVFFGSRHKYLLVSAGAQAPAKKAKITPRYSR